MSALGSLALLAALTALDPSGATPVGAYRLATVDGQKVPMLWRHAEHPEGGDVALHWIAGSAEIRSDGRFVVALTSLKTGPGLIGTPETLSFRGRWRVLSGFRIELRFDDGRVGIWGPGHGYARLTIKARCQDLEGQYRDATMVLVRS